MRRRVYMGADILPKGKPVHTVAHVIISQAFNHERRCARPERHILVQGVSEINHLPGAEGMREFVRAGSNGDTNRE